MYLGRPFGRIDFTGAGRVGMVVSEIDLDVSVEPKRIDAIAEPNNPLQSPLWGRVKRHTGWRPRAFSFASELGDGDLLALCRPTTDRYPHLYVPFGPEIELESELQGPFLEGLSQKLRSEVGPECIFVRYDLTWESPYSDAQAEDPPPHRVREIRMNFGTDDWNLRKSPTDVQPPDTVQLELHCDDDELLAAMKPKTRYNIRLSERRGVTVRRGGWGDLAAWYSIYRETSRRKGIVAADLEYFGSLLGLAAKEPENGTRVELLVAEHRDVFLGGIIVAAEGDIAVYLYGATDYQFRRMMPAYRLQWEAIRWARSTGCTTYDFHGIPPNNEPDHPMHGLYRFKTGFGGRTIHRRGCWDFPFDPDRYRVFEAVETATTGFHLA